MRPPGHRHQPPRSPGPVSFRLGDGQPFSPLAVITVGHPGASARSLRPWLHLLLSRARLGEDLFPIQSRRRLLATSPGDKRTPTATGNLRNTHHLRDAQQRHRSPPGHPLLSQLFIRESLITTIVFTATLSFCVNGLYLAPLLLLGTQLARSHFFLRVRRIWCLLTAGRREGRNLQPSAVLSRRLRTCSLLHK